MISNQLRNKTVLTDQLRLADKFGIRQESITYGILFIFVVVIVSKTFTTAETMLNARTLREWISNALG